MKLIGRRRKFQSPILIMLSLMLVLSNFFTIGLSVTVSADDGDGGPEVENTVYVSQSGDDDSNDGSESTPYGTIQKGFEEVADEGTIVLLSDLTVSDQITIDQNVTIRSEDGKKHSIIRDGDMATNKRTIQVTGGTVLFENLIIDGNNTVIGNTVNAIYGNGGTTTFKNVEMKDHVVLGTNGGSVVMAYSSGKVIISEDTKIHSNVITGRTESNPPSILGAGSGGSLIIEGGLITKNTVQGEKDKSNGVIVGLGSASSPSFTMTGGEIKANDLLGDGENADGKTVGNVAVYMRGTASQAAFNFGSTAYVFDNKDDNDQQRNVFLNNTSPTGSAYLFLTEEMNEGAKVGVFANVMPSSNEPTVDVAIGNSSYTAKSSDAEYFSSDKDTEAVIQFDEQNDKVVLTEEGYEFTPLKNAPGGVSDGLTSWVDVGKSANDDVTKLIDLVDDGEWNVRSGQGTLGTLNFNDAISVNGSNNFFRRDQFNTEDTAREVFSVQAKSQAGFPWEFGGRTDDENRPTVSYTTEEVKVDFGIENELITIESEANLTDGSLLNIWSAENDWATSINGHIKKTLTDKEVGFGSSNNRYYVGAGHSAVFNGLIPETMMYDRKLSEEERQKVSSYLAFKYGLTLDSDYVSSNGTKIWKKDNTYNNRITGIGRDNDSSLNQKQSKSEVEGANVTIALGNQIEENNADNNNDFDSNTSFFVFGDDNGEGLERIYKVAKTSNFADTDITIAVDKIDGEYPTQLIVSNSDKFDDYKEKYFLTDGKVTLNSKDFANGDYFTFVSPSIIAILTEPIGATVDTSKPTFKGTATPGSTVKVKVSDNITLTTTADSNGNWSVTSDSDLPDGEYNIEVTAEKDGVTSSTDKRKLTVTTIDKSQLEARVEMAEDLDEDHYTPESWNTYQDALEEAETVLGNPNATQTEINDAYNTLKEAQDALELEDEDAGVDKSKLEAKTSENINEDAYTSKSWSQYKKALNAAQAVLDDEDATQEQVDQALEDLTIAQNALVKKGGLGSLIPSTGSLNPGFATDVYEYSMNVGNGTSQLTLTPEEINNGATITMTANGVEVTDGNIPLKVGTNTIVVKVEDETGIKTYTITINRAKASGGGGSSGGGGGGTTPTPIETTETIDVNLEIDGDNPIERTSVTVERTKKADGTVHDSIQLTKDKADEAIAKAKESGNNIARIIIPDVKDEVDTVTASIPKASVEALRENGLSLEIATEHAIISLDNEHMTGIDDDFYFYVVPVKKESERQAIEERARVEKVVREAMKSDDIEVVARPMTIETNLSSRPVTITLPLNDVTLPTNADERDAYLQALGIFIEHTDGEKVVVFPKVVEMKDGKYGLQFTIEKFSTFTIIHLGEDLDGDGKQGKHEPYIKGFLNGEFGPELDVARLQMARMMAKLLGYSGEEYATYAPFKDIPKDHEGSGVIAFMKEQGIFSGDEDGNFRPWDPITRAHMAIIGANYKQLDIKENISISFDDTKGHWARWIIEASRQAGIIQGYENGTFLPEDNVSRQHSVLILNRMFDRGPLYGIESLNFSDIPRSYVYFNDIAEAAIAHEYIIDENGKEQLVK